MCIPTSFFTIYLRVTHTKKREFLLLLYVGMVYSKERDFEVVANVQICHLQSYCSLRAHCVTLTMQS